MQITAHTPTVLGVSQIGNPLDESQINNALNSAYWRVKVVEETGSTQSDISENVRSGRARSGDVLVAEYQSNGRGRLDRNFIAAPRTALLFSLFYLLPQKIGVDGNLGWLPLLASQAVHASLLSFAPRDSDISLSLKWPNDVVINEKKVAGLLCERVTSEDGAGVVIGIGINVSMTSQELPVSTASSLALEGFYNLDRENLLVSILQNLTSYLKRWEFGDEALVQQYIACSSTIGRAVRAEMPAGVVHESKAVGVDKTGALILEDNTVISVGDIIHLR